MKISINVAKLEEKLFYVFVFYPSLDLTYTTYDELSKDLMDKKVDGLLVDAYWVGKNMELFSKPGMMISKIFEHEKWYGVILNGPITSAQDALRDTVMNNELQITLMFDRYKTNIKVPKIIPTYIN